MPFVGLVSDPRWEPPEGSEPDPERRRAGRFPWRALLWIAVMIGVLLLVPVVTDLAGAFAGYLLLCFAIGLGFWRVDRWCARQYWRGLRDYQS